MVRTKVVVFYHTEASPLPYIHICEILHNMELYFKHVVLAKNGSETHGTVNDLR